MQLRLIFASALTVSCMFGSFTAFGDPITMDEFLSTLGDGGKMSGDAEVNVNGALTVDRTIDLNGKTLVFLGVNGALGGGGIITDTSEGDPGTLEMNVRDEGQVTNDSILIKGNLKVVKTGTGSFSTSGTSKYQHEWKAGTIVEAGTLTAAKRGKGIRTIFGDPCNVTVKYGAFVYNYAACGFDPAKDTIILNGGTLCAGYSEDSYAFKPALVLEDDSFYSPGNKMVLGSSINLNNHTLTVTPTAALTWKPSLIENGTIYLNSGNFTLGADVGMPATGVPTASLNLGAKANVAGDFIYSVKDLTMATGASVIGTIDVYGVYKPDETVNEHVRMQGGSTLNLTNLSVAAEMSAANFGSGTVTIALGDRTLESNQKIVSWSTRPANVNFNFTGKNVEADKFTISDVGIVYDAKNDTVTSATWTGAGEAGNWMDPANWSCKNAAGEVIATPVLTKDLTVTFTGDVSSVPFGESFPFAGVYFDGATLTKETDWTGFDLNLMTDASVLDLNGQALTVSAGTGESMTAATITSTVEGAALTFVVGEGETYTNSSLNLSGNLKLVKDGAGTFVATKPSQEYVGVTEIGGGIVRCGCVNMSGKTPFGASKTIDLVNGVLDPMGSYNWTGHTINMKGGLISNSVAEFERGTTYNANTRNQFNPTISVLDANACLATTEDFNFQGRIDVGAGTETLVLRIPFGKQFFWNPSATANVHLKVTGGGIFDIWQKNPVTYAKNPNFTLEVEDAALNLHKYNSTDMAGGLDVLDYISAYTNSVNNGTAVLNVAGTFTPASDYFYGCTMLDGSKIDLSSKTEPWSITSLSAGNNTVKFAADATVTLKLGDREVTPGDLIVAWEKRPVDVTFAFAGANVDSEIPAVWADEGLRYGYAEEPQIVWTNGGGDGDLTNPANWEDGVVPTDIKATFTGDVSNIYVPADKTFAAEKIWFKEATLSKDANFSWLDLNKVASDSILDLCGHDLKLSCVDGGCTNAGTVTDSASEGGTVTFVVPEGVTYTNSNFNFTGSLNFVKDGAGVLVAEKYPQLYTGTTTVKAGGVRCAEKANMNATDKQSPFGVTRTITLEEGSFLDPAGSANWGFHTVNMNGGIISNTVERMDVGPQYSSTTFNNPFNPTINLMVDSLFVSTKTFTFKGSVKGDGRTLVVKILDVRWASSQSDAVTIEFVGTGRVRSLKHFQTNEPKVTLIMNGAKFDAGGAWAVSNYVAKSASAFADIRSAEDAKLYVTGTFTPEADDFFGCTMQNGSVIDLSKKTDTWSIVRSKAATPGPVDYVQFAKGAEVTLDFGNRSISSRKPILSWTEETRPADGVTFKLTDAALANHYVIDVRDDGVYAKRKGMMLLLW